MATRRVIVAAAALASFVLAGGGAAGAAARIVGEWDPGLSTADVGGRITVNGYGVGGLGLYLLDGGVVAVCVQADIGHDLTAGYAPDTETAVSDRRLDYLLWRYAGRATDVEAAALNVLAWRYAGASRRSGGPVWTGGDLAVDVVGGARLVDVEAAAGALAAEAEARQGPWELVDLTLTRRSGGVRIAVTLQGPGGPIAGAEVRVDTDEVAAVAMTDADGRAIVDRDSAPAGAVVVTANGPGPLVTWSAPGSQRLAVGASVVVRAEHTPPPLTTSTSTTTTTTASTAVSTTTSTTNAPATTSTSSFAAPPPPLPPPTTSTPTTVTLPATGRDGRGVARWASILFLAGALAVLSASGRPPRRSLQ